MTKTYIAISFFIVVSAISKLIKPLEFVTSVRGYGPQQSMAWPNCHGCARRRTCYRCRAHWPVTYALSGVDWNSYSDSLFNSCWKVSFKGRIHKCGCMTFGQNSKVGWHICFRNKALISLLIPSFEEGVLFYSTCAAGILLITSFIIQFTLSVSE